LHFSRGAGCGPPFANGRTATTSYPLGNPSQYHPINGEIDRIPRFCPPTGSRVDGLPAVRSFIDRFSLASFPAGFPAGSPGVAIRRTNRRDTRSLHHKMARSNPDRSATTITPAGNAIARQPA
jgi:hypothetical protein